MKLVIVDKDAEFLHQIWGITDERNEELKDICTAEIKRQIGDKHGPVEISERDFMINIVDKCDTLEEVIMMIRYYEDLKINMGAYSDKDLVPEKDN